MRTKYICQHCGLIVAVSLALVAGCGPAAKPSGDVTGKVTYKGAVVPDAKIQIQSPETGYADGAKLDAAGKYQFATPVVAGKYNVSIEPIIQQPVAGTAPATTKPAERADIPKKYRSSATSELTLTVTKGKTTTFDVDMKD